MDTAGILLLAIALFAVPAWIPIIAKRKVSPAFKRAFWATAASELVLAIFVILVAANFLPLSDSWRTSALGVPLCIAGLVLGIVSRVKSERGTGCVISSAFGLLLWAFLVSLH
jgi:hypothetical protein